MDLEYIDTWSFGQDLKLLLLTIPAVLSGRGAY
jgi:lipopolysaccharide/colanic/teichoic acid biosynthesis glycosyltransferase